MIISNIFANDKSLVVKTKDLDFTVEPLNQQVFKFEDGSYLLFIDTEQYYAFISDANVYQGIDQSVNLDSLLEADSTVTETPEESCKYGDNQIKSISVIDYYDKELIYFSIKEN